MSTSTTLLLTENNTGETVAEFVVATSADVVAAHSRLLELARSIYPAANEPREALPVQSQVNDVVLGDADYVTALGYTLTRKPEPAPEPEPEAEVPAEDDSAETRLTRVESMLHKFAAHFGVTL